MGKMRNANRILVGKTGGKIRLGRLKYRWDNIKIVLREIRFEVMDWIYMAQNRNRWRAVLDTVTDFRIP
jgi:hypothetical protein